MSKSDSAAKKGRFSSLLSPPRHDRFDAKENVMKRNMLMLAAAFLSASALAAPGLDLSPNSEIFQYGDSLYTLDRETGGAVRVGAIWDGFTPRSS